MHLAIGDKIYRNCLLKCCTWTRVHERQTKVGESWSQMVEDNVNTKPEKQQFNTQFVIIEGNRGSYVSLYTKDQEHTRSITTTFIFFALRLLAQPSKFISNVQRFLFKNFTNLMLYWKSMMITQWGKCLIKPAVASYICLPCLAKFKFLPKMDFTIT